MAHKPQEGTQERSSTHRRYAGLFHELAAICVPFLPLVAAVTAIGLLAWFALWPAGLSEQQMTDSFHLVTVATPVMNMTPAAPRSRRFLDTPGTHWADSVGSANIGTDFVPVGTPGPWDWRGWPCEGILRDARCPVKTAPMSPHGN